MMGRPVRGRMSGMGRVAAFAAAVLTLGVGCKSTAPDESGLASNLNTRVAGLPRVPGRVMIQLFNWRFADIQKILPQLVADGYGFVYVSPPQKSHETEAWWGRYQPIDFSVIEGPLGNEAEFKAMIVAAHKAGLQVIVDIVYNHLANQQPYAATLDYPQFNKQDFHPRRPINNYNDQAEVRAHWINGDLPDLDTSSPKVRAVAKAYFKKLLDLGVDGFRLDAAKHIEPEFYDEVLPSVPKDKFIFGEIIARNPDVIEPYLIHMDAYDFPLAAHMVQVFAPSGDMRQLVDPRSQGKALAGDKAVTWAANHDTYLDQYQGFNFANRLDRDLAMSFLLARPEGMPMIFVTYAGDPTPQAAQFGLRQDPVVAAGVHFYNLCNGLRGRFAVAEPGWLLIERGDRCLASINKTESEAKVSATAAGLKPGSYVDLESGATLAIGGKEDALVLKPRSARFLYRR